MELVSLKIIILTISGVIRIFCGLIPLIIFRAIIRDDGTNKQSKIKKIISYLMFFGGGVLLATCLIHMMPEVRENFNEANLNTKLPIAELIFIGGFFMIYLLEDIIHGFIHRRHIHNNNNNNKQHIKNNQRQHSHSQQFPSSTTISNENITGIQNHGFSYNITPPSSVSISSKQMFGNHLIGKQYNEIPGLTTSIPRVRSTSSDNNKLNGSSTSSSGGGISTIDPKFTYIDGDWWRDNNTNIINGHSQINLLNSNTNLNLRSNSMYEIPLNGKSSINKIKNNHAFDNNSWGNEHEHEHGHDSEHNDSGGGHSHMHIPSSNDEENESMATTFRNLLIIIAMSFHGIFEGMAIGLQGTERDVLLFFLAVSLHECTILFCIGVELISSQTKIIRMITYILVVSLVCPIGIAIGIIISENSFDPNTVERAIVVGTMQGLAAGTLLYVTFFEIFAVEGRNLKQKYFHILVAIIGFIFMVFLEFIGGHSHNGHGHSHDLNSTTTMATITDSDHDHEHGHAPSGHHNIETVHDHDHDHDHSH